jgi:hypothetical protein
MTAPNHALTGALIGLAVPNMWLGIPLAIASHFLLDTIPHYGVAEGTSEEIIGSRKFLYIQLVGGFVLCVMLVALLWWYEPAHWFSAAVCAFMATSPDLLSAPRYVSVKQGKKDPVQRWWFWRIHHGIQKEHSRYLPVEVTWFAVALLLLIAQL